MLSILNKHSVLYVEDEPDIQASIAEYLENHFSTTHLASNGKKALELYNRYNPDVLLLDINLPDIDGLTLAKDIRQKDHTIKIIMLTAYTEKEKLLKATELKLTKYLVKPVPPKAFKETMEILAKELICNPSTYLSLSENCLWNKKKAELFINGNLITLTEKERRLLKLFISYKGKSISYEKIMANVWENTFDREISIDSVKNQVSHLRKKLPECNISSVYGQGYILN